MKKNILAIDPGFTNAGYSIWSVDNKKLYLHDFSVFSQRSSESITLRLGRFFDFFQQKIITHAITHLCLETPFLGKNPSNFLKLGYLRGALNLLSYQHNIELFEISPREIKLAVTGYGHADKLQVKKALAMLLPTHRDKVLAAKDDASDALALGFCYAMTKS